MIAHKEPAVTGKPDVDEILDLLQRALEKVDALGGEHRVGIHISEAIERLRSEHDPIAGDSNLPLTE